MVRSTEMWLMATAVAVAVMAITEADGRAPVRHKVGGANGWTQNVNYTEWTLHETFYVGDWLYFCFDKHLYNVLEVNETNYEQCNDQKFITNITKGGRDVLELTHARPYYFLSSGGYCYHGMKLSIDVVDFKDDKTPASAAYPTPPPPPAKNNSPMDHASCSVIVLPVLLVVALASAFI